MNIHFTPGKRQNIKAGMNSAHKFNLVRADEFLLNVKRWCAPRNKHDQMNRRAAGPKLLLNGAHERPELRPPGARMPDATLS